MRLQTITAMALFSALAFPNPVQAGAAQPYEGLKKTVSVDLFAAAEAVGGSVTSEGLTAMLVDALAKDGRFIVVERPGLASVQAEQTLGASGATTAETAAKSNQMIGANVLVKGAVIKYEPDSGGASAGVGGLPMGSLFGSRASVSHKTALLAISLRLIDTTTGQVLSTTTSEGTASANGAGVDVVSSRSGATFGADLFQKTPIGQAAQDAIKKGVEQIAAGMRNVPWSALVVEANGGTIYVNAGADRNIQPGMVLQAYHKGKVLTDPGTGEVLDVEMSAVGTIKIDAVRAKLSTASVVSGSPPERGDLLKQN